MSEPAIWGRMHWGKFRWGVYYPIVSGFSKILDRMKKAFGLSGIIWQERIEVGLDPISGKTIFTFIETSIDALIRRVRAEEIFLEPGATPEQFLRIYCRDSLKLMDRIKYKGYVYEVLPPQTYKSRDNVAYRTALLKRLKMEAKS